MKKLSYFLLFLLIVCTSCKKENDVIDKKQQDEQVSSRFFAHSAEIDPSVKQVLNEIMRRNNNQNFVSQFSTDVGFPVWTKAIVKSIGSKGTVVYIPVVMDKTRQTNAVIRAVINDDIQISTR